MESLHVKNLSKRQMRLIADNRGIKAEKNIKKDKLSEILRKYNKIIYDESPFKSINLDIRSILPKKGCKTIKKIIKYIEEIKELTSLQLENIKNSLIKVKSKKINRVKKADREYYEYEDNKFYGLKDLRNLFDQMMMMIFMKKSNICLMKMVSNMKE